MVSLYHNGINGILADEMVSVLSQPVLVCIIADLLSSRVLVKLYKLFPSLAISNSTGTSLAHIWS
jgi:hypothetical protein